LHLSDYKKLFTMDSYVASNGPFGAPGLLELATADARWDLTFETVDSEMGIDLILPTLHSNASLIKSTDLVKTFVTANYETSHWSTVTLLGGTAGAFAGYLYRNEMDPSNVSSALNKVLVSAFERGQKRGAHLILLHADQGLIDSCCRLSRLGANLEIKEVGLRAVLFVRDLQTYSSKVRATYTSDLRKFKLIGLSWTIVDWRVALDAAGDMFVALKERYGRKESVRRIREEILEVENGGGVDVRGVIINSANGDVVAGSIVSMHQDVMHVIEVGMNGDPKFTRESYFAAVFHAPIEIARANNISTIDFGLSASTPKKARGAVLQPSYLVDMY
jgi:hypothetical protein